LSTLGYSAILGHIFQQVGIQNINEIFLGVTGYVLGARGLGIVTMLVCTATMFLGLLVAQGVIPSSYDRVVDGFFRDIRSILGTLQ
jgi:hypothetical protein